MRARPARSQSQRRLKRSGPAGQLDEACAGEGTLASQLSMECNLEIESKLAEQIESFDG